MIHGATDARSASCLASPGGRRPSLAPRGTSLAACPPHRVDNSGRPKSEPCRSYWNNMATFGTPQTPRPTSHLPPVPPRAATHASDIWVSLSVAGVLCLAAATIALWPTRQDEKTKHKTEVPALSVAGALPASAAQTTQTTLSEVESSPTRIRNPFDASEVFEFPPGTPEDTARESVAETLLERARERRARLSSAKHARSRQSAPVQAPTLMSETLFKRVT